MTTKQLTYELIPTDTPLGETIYEMLEELREEHHEDLARARIAIAWNRSWKPDVDGRMTLGKLRKASDLDRELMDYDFVVILNEEFWTHPDVVDHQRRALLDHELCHGAMKVDAETLEPVEDAKGRQVWRIVKHDVEDFSAVVRRWGCWRSELEDFFGALKKGREEQPPLPGIGDGSLDSVREAVERLRPKPGSGIDSVSLTGPDGRGTRLNADGTTEAIEGA